MSEGYGAPAAMSRVQRYCNLIPINGYGPGPVWLEGGKPGPLPGFFIHSRLKIVD
jgi:hypothetical protein